MAVTLDPAHTSATISLDASELVATNTGTAVVKATLATVGYSSGKRVYAAIISTLATGDDMALGLVLATHSLTSRIDNSADAMSTDPGGDIVYNNASIGTLPTFGSGAKIYWALDYTNNKFWVKVGSGGLWNSSGTANPDTNTGGIPIPFALQSKSLFPILEFHNVDGVWTFDPFATGHGLTTFTPWDGASTQTLTASLLSNSNTFYGPTVTPGPVTLSASLLTNSSTFYSPSVTATDTLLAPLLVNTSDFYSPTVTPGAITLAPPLLANANVFYSPTVTLNSGDQTLSPPLLVNVSTLYAPTVAPAPYPLNPPLLTNASEFYEPTVTVGPVTVTPGLLQNVNTFFSPTVSLRTQVLSAPLLVNESAFYPPVVTGGGERPPAPASRTVAVLAEYRQARVAAEQRLAVVAAENRTLVALGDDRLAQA